MFEIIKLGENMKMFNQKIITSIFVFFIIILLSISIIMANNVFIETNIEVDKEEIYYEIKYLDSKIIYMSSLLNNLDNEVNWKELKKQTSGLYNYWNSVILDLNYLNINKADLTDFGKKLDELSVAINNYDKNRTLSKLIELYNKLIIYSEAINYVNYTNILLTKYNLLLSYSIIETGNWTLAHEYILKATENIYQVINSMETNQYMQYNINQAFVAVKELENMINTKDIEVFYIKYKIAIDKLENL